MSTVITTEMEKRSSVHLKFWALNESPKLFEKKHLTCCANGLSLLYITETTTRRIMMKMNSKFKSYAKVVIEPLKFLPMYFQPLITFSISVVKNTPATMATTTVTKPRPWTTQATRLSLAPPLVSPFLPAWSCKTC